MDVAGWDGVGEEPGPRHLRPVAETLSRPLIGPDPGAAPVIER